MKRYTKTARKAGKIYHEFGKTISICIFRCPGIRNLVGALDSFSHFLARLPHVPHFRHLWSVLSALLLTLTSNGRADLLALLRRLFIWRVSIFWYIVSFLAPAVIVLLAIGLHILPGRRGSWIQGHCTMVSGDSCFSLCALRKCTWGGDWLEGICLTRTTSQPQRTDR